MGVSERLAEVGEDVSVPERRVSWDGLEGWGLTERWDGRGIYGEMDRVVCRLRRYVQNTRKMRL